jgi:hypothetical protein
MESKAAIVLAAAAGLSLGGWMMIRTSIRTEVARALREDYDLDTLSHGFSAFGIDLHLPSSDEFAESLVPMWSTIGPKEAIEDVLAKGRTSDYWPAAYKTAKAPSALETKIFQILNALYQSKKDAAQQQKAG